ncbi:head-tail joining protein [Paraburkholderia sp. 35.1]|uniref:head-tail joining protein n=1 Tax=Paraburkholderia sp. 35.1 TaxID=2991058 RepID=UPI003D253FC9
MIDWDSVLLAPVEGVFGQAANHTTADGTTTTPLNGVFDEAVTDIDVIDGVPVTSKRPCFGFRVVQLAMAAVQGDTLLVFAASPAPLVDTTFVIREVRVDGHGWCFLLLNNAD